VTRIARPRYRRNRRRSRRLQRFLEAMSSKWDGEETTIAVSAVSSSGLDLASTPDVQGPLSLRGAPPPALRGIDRFWVAVGASDVCTVYRTPEDLAAQRGAVTLATWALSFTFVDADVTAATDVIAETAHGMETGDGPVRVSNSGGALPAGLAAATDYWVIAASANTFKLASSRANALAGTAVNITAAAGGGTHTLARALTVGKDFSADGMLEWLARGVKPQAMQFADVADVDSIFT